MAVKRLADAPLITDRMTNATGDRLSMSAPGSTPIVDPPSMTTDLSELAANGGAASAHVPVSDQSGRIRGDDGRFTQGGQWSEPAGHGAGGWDGV